jgi:hypothetical protein
MRKVEQYGAPKTPEQAQKMMSRLTPAERRAYMAAVSEQGAMPEPANRQQRRAIEKMQAGTKASGGSGKKASGKPGAKGRSSGKSSGRKKR